MTLRDLIIAIDGPVGSGKSTLARRVAELMGYVYIDTRAMYRALALKAVRRGLGLDREGHVCDRRGVRASKTSRFSLTVAPRPVMLAEVY